MEALYNEALDEISEKAQILGANAVLGLKMDMDNISGKGMSMFMITATGTAATIEFNSGKQEEEGAPISITSSVLVHEVTKRSILEKLSSEKAEIRKDSWEFILKNLEREFVVPLTNRLLYMVSDHMSYDSIAFEVFTKNYDQFLQMADRSLAIEPAYEALYHEATRNQARNLIKRHQLFAPKSILKLISSEKVSIAVELLNVEKSYYDNTDLHDMESIIDVLDNLPDLGKIEVVKGGMFSKDGEKYICPNGHKTTPLLNTAPPVI